MRILTPIRLPRLFVFSMIGALFAAAGHAGDDAAVFKAKLEAYHYFEPNLALPLPARVQTMPDESLQWIIAFDRSIDIANTDYKPHVVSPADIALFPACLRNLPGRRS